MIRNCSLEEISDGKKYGINDMARLGCNDCAGCSQCCRGMANTIILDPYDVFWLKKQTGKNMQELMVDIVELNMVDGVVLPNIKMLPDTDACYFLDSNGRCSIHAARPGVCRLFPLGRYYENGDFCYILQTDECVKKNLTKVKIEKWLDIPHYSEYRQFILRWHSILSKIGTRVSNATSEGDAKILIMSILNYFYIDFDADELLEFYEKFGQRADKIEELLR